MIASTKKQHSHAVRSLTAKRELPLDIVMHTGSGALLRQRGTVLNTTRVLLMLCNTPYSTVKVLKGEKGLVLTKPPAMQ